MQVVDLRPGRRSTPPTIELWSSTGAELVRAAAALTRNPCDGFDVGDDRLAELSGRLDDGVRDHLLAQPEEFWLHLTSLVARLEEPGTAEDLLTMLDARPLEVWRILFEQPLGDFGQSAPERWRADLGDGPAAEQEAEAVLDRYLAGDADADEVRAWVESLPDSDKLTAMLDPLLSDAPAAIVGELHATLTAIHRTVGAEMLAEAIGPMQREVVARRKQLEAGRHPGELVVEATNGYELSDDLPDLQAPVAPEDRQVLARWRVTDSVQKGGLNVRAAPDAGSADIGDLPHDATGVEVHGTDASGQWGQIIWQEGMGWISMRFLAPFQPATVTGTALPAGKTTETLLSAAVCVPR